MKRLGNYLLILLVALFGCDADAPRPVDIGFDYFPLQKGFFQIYDVNEIRYAQFQQPETLAYELKVEVVDSIPFEENEFTYIIYRSKRANASAAWSYVDTWSARRTDREALIAEGNTSFVKLIFPVRDGNAWDGNQYNNKGEDEYQLLIEDTPRQVGGMSFENTIMVEQELNDDIIVFQDQRKEVYAENAGLIYKEVTQLNYCTDNNCLGRQIINEGIVYRQSLKSYGKL